MSGQALRLVGVVRSFGASPALTGLDLELGESEILCLLGPSGCGKTTSLLIAAGIERPDDGEVWLNGRQVAGNGVFIPPEKRRVGLVFQDYALFPHMSALANTGFGLKRAGRAGRAQKWLDRLHIGDKARSYPHELSGGEQQRVALARALAPEPDILLLDEPFSSLDRHLRAGLRALVYEILRARATPCLFVTHDPEEAMRMGDRIALMRGGKIIQTGTPQELYDRPVDGLAAQFFGEVNLLPCQISAGRARAGIFSCPAENFAGDNPFLLIRPEAFSLRPPDDSPLAVRGQIIAASFLGGDSLLSLRLDELAPALIARLRGRCQPQAGEMITLYLRREDVRLLPRALNSFA